MDALAPASTKLVELQDQASSLMHKFFEISSIAVALRYVLAAAADCDHQPMVSAVELCSMIESMAQAEANRADEMAAALSQLQENLSR